MSKDFIKEQIVLVTEQQVREAVEDLVPCHDSFLRGVGCTLNILASAGQLSAEYGDAVHEKVKAELEMLR